MRWICAHCPFAALPALASDRSARLRPVLRFLKMPPDFLAQTPRRILLLGKSRKQFAMPTLKKLFGIVALLTIAAFAAPARAELPPGAYDELKRKAQELLQIRIDAVKEKEPISAAMRNFECTATVLRVDRSKSKLARGAKIKFDSYYVTPEAFERGFVGPKSPPLLAAGWTGRIYLNREEGKTDYSLAAYGRSFEPIGKQPQASPPPQAPQTERLGVTGYPATTGGLDVRTVDRNTLADDLGLRAGDRLITINGQKINSAADVGPALKDSKDHLQIQLDRNGRFLDLTLRKPS
jgi:hypothetical protein